MTYEHWNIWFTYSTYYLGDKLNLEDIASKLVSSNLCDVVFHSNGHATWKQANEVLTEQLILERIGEARTGEIAFPLTLTGFNRQCALTAAAMRFHESTIFSENLNARINYIRGYLGIAMIHKGESMSLIYPELKLYQNGVLTISFRAFSPDKTIDTTTLINEFINIPMVNTNIVFVKPELLKIDLNWAIKRQEGNIIQKYSDIKSLRKALELIDRGKTRKDLGDFQHDVMAIDPYGIFKKPIYNVHTVRQYIVSAVEGILNGSQGDLSYLLLGPKRNRWKSGNYWSGKPNVIVWSFKDQPKNASDIRDAYRVDIGRILSRRAELPESASDRYIPEPFTLFENSQTYITPGINLTVFSKRGAKRRKNSDLSRNDLIIPWQIKNELTEYIHLSTRKLEEQSLVRSGGLSEVFQIRESLTELAQVSRDISNFSDVSRIIENGLVLLRLDDLKSSIKENLELKAQRVQDISNTETQYVGTLLAVIFGLVGVTSLAKDILEPTWVALKITLPVSKGLAPAFYYIVSVAVFLIIIGCVLAMPKLRKSGS
jgi:hypothetical protein